VSGWKQDRKDPLSSGWHPGWFNLATSASPTFRSTTSTWSQGVPRSSSNRSTCTATSPLHSCARGAAGLAHAEVPVPHFPRRTVRHTRAAPPSRGSLDLFRLFPSRYLKRPPTYSARSRSRLHARGPGRADGDSAPHGWRGPRASGSSEAIVVGFAGVFVSIGLLADC